MNDISQELRDTENALRDFIASVLASQLGAGWVEQCGVTDDRIQRWRERKETEAKRQRSGVIEERLLYYSDFYDLKTILKKHWSHFSPALGEWKVIDVYLTQLESLRDPDAHRRELLPHQKHLVAGIGGELRTRMVRFRSKQETAEDYFPRFESARDSLGNLWVPGDSMNFVLSKHVLRPGDSIDFVLTATDPMGDTCHFAIGVDVDPQSQWQRPSTFTVRIAERHIGRLFVVKLYLRSVRSYHARGDVDDVVQFSYSVLPAK